MDSKFINGERLFFGEIQGLTDSFTFQVGDLVRHETKKKKVTNVGKKITLDDGSKVNPKELKLLQRTYAR